MNIIIVDDEENALELYKMETSDMDDITVAAAFSDPEEALAYLYDHTVDVAVLDVQTVQQSSTIKKVN